MLSSDHSRSAVWRVPSAAVNAAPSWIWDFSYGSCHLASKHTAFTRYSMVMLPGASSSSLSIIPSVLLSTQ